MSRVIVPVAILEGESVAAGLMNLLSTLDVTVLGYHVLPEQTPPDQARVQYEDRANEALEDVAEEFREAGGEADYRLVFTQDKNKTLQRVAEENQARAYAITGATGSVERILVPLSGDVAHDRILEFVTDVIGDRDMGVTLLLVAEEETAGEQTLNDAVERLSGHGIDVEAKLVVDKRPFDALVEAVPNHDAVIMGEQAPSIQSFLLGDVTERVAAETVGPVLVVRREHPDPDSEQS